MPPTIPHKYNEKLTNRIFKRRVIDMICNCIMDHVCTLPLTKVCDVHAMSSVMEAAR